MAHQRRPRPSGARILAALALSTVLAACSATIRETKGSRVDTGGPELPLASDAPGAGTDSTAVVDPAAPGGPTDAGGGTGTGRTGAGGGRTGGSGTAGGGTSGGAGGGGGGSGGGSGGGPGTFAQGVTDSTIKLGVFYITGYNEGIGQFGIKGVSTGDQQLEARATADYINANGGMAGRKVELVFAANNVAGSQDGATRAQAACTKFTEDSKVFAVIGPTTPADATPMLSCLAKRNTPFISTNFGDQQLYDEYANHYFVPSDISLTRVAKAYIDGLHAQGYFDGSTKIGLLSWDEPQYLRAVDKVVRPALAAHGLTLAEHAAITYNKSLAEAGASVNQIQGAQLRFAQRQVSHVLFLDTFGIEVLFMQNAEPQGYRPRYGLSSNSSPVALSKNASAQQLRRSVGIGWMPELDVAEPGPNATTGVCLDIMKRAGEQYSDNTAAQTALSYCDWLLFLKAAVDRTPNTITPAGLRSAVGALGEAHVSPVTFASRFPGGRRDGGAAVRNIAFDESCGCFRYTSGVRSIG